MRTSPVISRRCWLDVVSRAAFGALALGGRQQLHAFGDEARTDRIRRVIDEYSAQGPHRTGTQVDERSGDWLADLVRAIGATPMRERFSLSRVDPVDCRVVIADRQIAGLPLFDAAFTNADGVAGTLGPIGSDAEIGSSTRRRTRPAQERSATRAVRIAIARSSASRGEGVRACARTTPTRSSIHSDRPSRR
jgi:hypothetical protein